jgi:hypothetical protein
MKKIACIIPVFMAFMLVAPDVASQIVEVSGQIKPRYEMRHGYGSLFPDGAQASNFVSQRSRLNFGYSNERFRVGFSVQHIGVWGETGTMRMSDINGASVHEAWGEVIISPKVAVKAGRQVISYDDQRIFGGVDWAQQARSHDAIVISLKPREGCKLDFGIAYNAMTQSNVRQYYGMYNYKAMQYAHWQRGFGNFSASVLFLNNGLAWRDGTDTTDSGSAKEKIAYSQTLGFRLTYKKEKLSANGAFYFQAGKTSADTTNDGAPESTRKISAFYFALDAAYRFSDQFSAGAGIEYFSGNSMKDPSEKDQAFKPLYGTNHKFNGWMDYFYVGNHMNSVGLLDIFIPLTYKKDKFSASLTPHIFQSTGDIYAMGSEGSMQDFGSGLGTEIDLGLGYAIAPNVMIQAGYSQMFATESMQVLKGGNHKSNNNWAWVMIDFKPTFFKSDK